MDRFLPDYTAAEQDFYGDSLILLEGILSEFLSCLDMIRRYQISRGKRDPVSSLICRIKSARSMQEKLQRQGLPLTVGHALHNVYDAAGVRIICPFVDDIDIVAELIRGIPGVTILQEKDYIRHPKPNGYQSYHMILSLPLRFLAEAPAEPVWLELQIRTIAMDCWASIEHQLKYKKTLANQALIIEELTRCAHEIASTDLSLQTIRDLVMDSGKEEAFTQ